MFTALVVNIQQRLNHFTSQHLNKVFLGPGDLLWYFLQLKLSSPWWWKQEGLRAQLLLPRPSCPQETLAVASRLFGVKGLSGPRGSPCSIHTRVFIPLLSSNCSGARLHACLPTGASGWSPWPCLSQLWQGKAVVGVQ